MTKHVVQNAEVCHLWANQAQDSARSDNRSFRGPDAYSYGALIGRIATNEQGVTAYLIANYGWSDTTKRAQGDLRQAISRDRLTFELPSLSATPVENVQSMLEEAAALQVKAGRARTMKAHWLQQAESLLRQAIAYAAWAGIPAPEVDLETLVAQRKEAEAQQREAQRAYEARQEQARKEAHDKFLAETLPAWIAGEPLYSYYRAPESYLRIVGEECQTTQGATVPAEHVRKALPRILAMAQDCARYQRAWTPPADRTIRLGHYTMQEIWPDGTVVVGCHRFKLPEVKRVYGLFYGAVSPQEHK